MRYDLVVVGSGPAGQKAAIAAAKQNWNVALVERRRELLGGVSLHTGTIPSKTIREAILHLTGYRHRDVYEESYRRKREITMNDLRLMIRNVGQSEWQVIQDQFARNRIHVACGEASFLDPHHIEVSGFGEAHILEARHVLLAPGTRPARPAHVPFNGQTIFDSDEVLGLNHVPRSMIVVGGGVIGLEYAIMFATLGVQVTVVDGRSQLLEFCDREIIETLLHHARSLGMVFRLGESVVSNSRAEAGPRCRRTWKAANGYWAKRCCSVSAAPATPTASTSTDAGLDVDNRGRICCNAHFQTAVPHIYAVGDVVGFPALASTSMEQGRRAACHMLGREFEPCEHMPYGLFTIPEISMVGQNEEQLTEARVPYEVGMARFSEIARGQIAGDTPACSSFCSIAKRASCSACMSSANRRPRSSTSARP